MTNATILRVADVCAALEAFAPPVYAESYDNVGLLVGRATDEIQKALVTLDVTEGVVEYAAENGYGLVVSHHPIWFGAKKRLTGEDLASRCIMKAIRAGVALYAAHTNLDNVVRGVNAKMGEKLALKDVEILQPRAGDASVGSGMLGTLGTPMEKTEFLAHVKTAFQTPVVRHNGRGPTHISRVAVCGGAGSFLISAAQNAHADALVTADVSYHKFFDAELFLLDVGHYESEQYTTEILFEAIKNKFPNFDVGLLPFSTNPVYYHQ